MKQMKKKNQFVGKQKKWIIYRNKIDSFLAYLIENTSPFLWRSAEVLILGLLRRAESANHTNDHWFKTRNRQEYNSNTITNYILVFRIDFCLTLDTDTERLLLL